METWQGDITTYPCDAIVNAANKSLLGGAGVDGAVHQAAGPELVEYCRKLNGCPTGQTKLTPGFNLPAQYILHTVGPVWHGGNMGEPELLKSCYQTSLKIASGKQLKSIAFPSISTGIYGYPQEKAANLAVSTILNFCRNDTSLEQITLVAFSSMDFEYLQNAVSKYSNNER